MTANIGNTPSSSIKEKQSVNDSSTNLPQVKKPDTSLYDMIETPKGQLSKRIKRRLSEFAQGLVMEDVSTYYNIGKEIGSGKYGVVRLVSRKSYEKKRFALKSIHRQHMNTDLEHLEQEFQILKSVDHPNIIQFYETYVDENYVHFVTEFCGGGELFEHIIARGRFNESYAAKIIK